MSSEENVDVDSDAVRRIVERALEIEEENLHYKTPPNILNNLQDMIKEEIQ